MDSQQSTVKSCVERSRAWCLLPAFAAVAMIGLGTLSPHPAAAQALPLPLITPGDHDSDGIPDEIDVDDDNDTVSDDNEGSEDTDGDGVPNHLDSDSDNDGIPDLVEHVRDQNLLFELDFPGSSLESADEFEGLLSSNQAVGLNGLADITETFPDSGLGTTGFFDTDNDGVRDQLDPDSDNDGLPDIHEFGCGPFGETEDRDRDGRIDNFVDANGDGLHDLLDLVECGFFDQDLDGELDYRDQDSDNDGLSDALEAFDDDADGDGQLDRFTDIDMDGLDDQYATILDEPFNTDGDEFPDFLDLDSDNDGIFDSQEGNAQPGATPPGPSEQDPQDPDEQPGEAPQPIADEPGESPVPPMMGSEAPEPNNSPVNDGSTVDEPITTGRKGGVGCSMVNGSSAASARGMDLPLLVLMAVAACWVRARHRRVRQSAD